jgi:hypothetical protein
MWGHETRICEVMQEEASAAENVDPKCVTEWTARGRGALSSPPKMAIEAVENRLDRSVEGHANSARPVSQMLRRSEMSASGELRVPVLTQLVCDACHVGPGRADPQIPNTTGRLEVLERHDVLLSWGRHDNAEESAGDTPDLRDHTRQIGISSA